MYRQRKMIKWHCKLHKDKRRMMAKRSSDITIMKIAIDAMGGDNAPKEIVLGAMKASTFLI